MYVIAQNKLSSLQDYALNRKMKTNQPALVHITIISLKEILRNRNSSDGKNDNSGLHSQGQQVLIELLLFYSTIP